MIKNQSNLFFLGFFFFLCFFSLSYATNNVVHAAEKSEPITSPSKAPEMLQKSLPPQVEFSTVRMSKNKSHERLVLEFAPSKDLDAGEEKTSSPINVSSPLVTMDTKNKTDFILHLSNVELIGGISESDLDNVIKKSNIFQSLQINLEEELISLEIKLHKEGNVKAFWLENPYRLVIDARGLSMPLYKKEGIFGAKEHNKKHMMSSSRSTDVPADDMSSQKSPYICFRESSRVGLSIKFKEKTPNGEHVYQTISIPLDGAPSSQLIKINQDDGIVCYPKSKQVFATLNFEGESSLGFDNPFIEPLHNEVEEKGINPIQSVQSHPSIQNSPNKKNNPSSININKSDTINREPAEHGPSSSLEDKEKNEEKSSEIKNELPSEIQILDREPRTLTSSKINILP